MFIFLSPHINFRLNLPISTKKKIGEDFTEPIVFVKKWHLNNIELQSINMVYHSTHLALLLQFLSYDL